MESNIKDMLIKNGEVTFIKFTAALARQRAMRAFLTMVGFTVLMIVPPAFPIPVSALIKLGPEARNADAIKTLNQLPQVSAFGWRPVFAGSAAPQPIVSRSFESGYLTRQGLRPARHVDCRMFGWSGVALPV